MWDSGRCYFAQAALEAGAEGAIADAQARAAAASHAAKEAEARAAGAAAMATAHQDISQMQVSCWYHHCMGVPGLYVQFRCTQDATLCRQ